MNLSQIAATALILILAAVPVVAMVVLMARSRMNPLQCVLWATAFLLCKFLWRTRWEGSLRLAGDQGAVIVCNHRSSVDPFFLQTATSRKTHWMVAREYCEHPALRWLLRNCEVIPVGRGGIDITATKAAIRIVSQGGLVGMLPEGRINRTDKLMLPARPGAALVAIKARVPVVPCFIIGSPFRYHVWSPIFMPARVTVRIGEPVDLSDFYERDSDPEAIREAMQRVLKAMVQLAGRPDFEPQFAGRHWLPQEE